jgi:hypothetical protein
VFAVYPEKKVLGVIVFLSWLQDAAVLCAIQRLTAKVYV